MKERSSQGVSHHICNRQCRHVKRLLERENIQGGNPPSASANVTCVSVQCACVNTGTLSIHMKSQQIGQRKMSSIRYEKQHIYEGADKCLQDKTDKSGVSRNLQIPAATKPVQLKAGSQHSACCPVYTSSLKNTCMK